MGNPDISVDFNDLEFGRGVLLIDYIAPGLIVGRLDFDEHYQFRLSGVVQSGDPPTFAFRGVNDAPESEGEVYEYFGCLMPLWSHDRRQRPTIVGSVIRLSPLTGDPPTALASNFIALKQVIPAKASPAPGPSTPGPGPSTPGPGPDPSTPGPGPSTPGPGPDPSTPGPGPSTPGQDPSTPGPSSPGPSGPGPSTPGQDPSTPGPSSPGPSGPGPGDPAPQPPTHTPNSGSSQPDPGTPGHAAPGTGPSTPGSGPDATPDPGHGGASTMGEGNYPEPPPDHRPPPGRQ